jgi:hypothetical protein
VVGNFTGRPRSAPDPGGEIVVSTQGPAQPSAGVITLAPWQGIVARTAGR